ncbi:hypothetical protein AVEN_46644-1 [Araneus ventricosus]|uniref:F-box domain-containing protein n=1 Tax=Araneus ventricosus TaxID=182803 RepID=A0A4Y2K9G6_ARAVE|nr:hypothetical protein AVEN_46644-1 [Araneus ventricosus]
MTPPSLYNMCLQKTVSLLKERKWMTTPQNSFLRVPPRIIDDLITTSLDLPDSDNPKTVRMRLLLESGRIQHLDLAGFMMDNDQDVLLTTLSEDCCRLLKSMNIPQWIKPHKIEPVLEICYNLECIHSEIEFDLNALRNNEKLRILKLHLSENSVFNMLDRKSIDFYRSLQYLEVFALCSKADYFTAWRAVSTILENCPNLVSVGYADTSLAMRDIYRKKNGRYCQFSLKRCVWGSKYWSRRNILRYPTDKLIFPNLIQTLVSSCQLIEELLMKVPNEDCLQYLAGLKNLTLLNIDFRICYDDCMSSFNSMLAQLGPQLKHIFIQNLRNTTVDVIVNNCPNLISLRIEGPAVISDTAASSDISMQHLQRFRLSKNDPRVILFFLSNSPHLKEIYLDSAEGLNDSLLRKILERNSLSELEIASIYCCSLLRGVRLFLQTAVSLKKASFIPIDKIVSDISHELHRNIEICSFYDLKKMEFFQRKFDSCEF